MKKIIASELQNRDYINLNYNSQLMKKKLLKVNITKHLLLNKINDIEVITKNIILEDEIELNEFLLENIKEKWNKNKSSEICTDLKLNKFYNFVIQKSHNNTITNNNNNNITKIILLAHLNKLLIHFIKTCSISKENAEKIELLNDILSSKGYILYTNSEQRKFICKNTIGHDYIKKYEILELTSEKLTLNNITEGVDNILSNIQNPQFIIDNTDFDYSSNIYNKTELYDLVDIYTGNHDIRTDLKDILKNEFIIKSHNNYDLLKLNPAFKKPSNELPDNTYNPFVCEPVKEEKTIKNAYLKFKSNLNIEPVESDLSSLYDDSEVVDTTEPHDDSDEEFIPHKLLVKSDETQGDDSVSKITLMTDEELNTDGSEDSGIAEAAEKNTEDEAKLDIGVSSGDSNTFNVLFQKGQISKKMGRGGEDLLVGNFHKQSDGSTLNTYYQNYDWLEDAHDYIQRLFPNKIRSRAIGSRDHILTDLEIALISSDSGSLNNIKESLRTMMDFYGATIIYSPSVKITPNINHLERLQNIIDKTHNLKRITRILTCLQLLNLIDLQNAVFQYFAKSIKDTNTGIPPNNLIWNKTIFQESLNLWVGTLSAEKQVEYYDIVEDAISVMIGGNKEYSKNTYSVSNSIENSSIVKETRTTDSNKRITENINEISLINFDALEETNIKYYYFNYIYNKEHYNICYIIRNNIGELVGFYNTNNYLIKYITDIDNDKILNKIQEKINKGSIKINRAASHRILYKKDITNNNIFYIKYPHKYLVGNLTNINDLIKFN